jgi:hypothetical protein
MIIRLSDILQEGKKDTVSCPLFWEFDAIINKKIIDTQNLDLLKLPGEEIKTRWLQTLTTDNVAMDLRFKINDMGKLFTWLTTQELGFNFHDVDYYCDFYLTLTENITVHFTETSWFIMYLGNAIQFVKNKLTFDALFTFEGDLAANTFSREYKQLMTYWTREVIRLAKATPGLWSCLQNPNWQKWIENNADSQLKKEIITNLKHHGSDFGFLE